MVALGNGSGIDVTAQISSNPPSRAHRHPPPATAANTALGGSQLHPHPAVKVNTIPHEGTFLVLLAPSKKKISFSDSLRLL